MFYMFFCSKKLPLSLECQIVITAMLSPFFFIFYGTDKSKQKLVTLHIIENLVPVKL